MIKNLLTISALIMCVFTMNAQTTILDFENPETSAVFDYFGSTLESTTTSIIANPDPSGINTSSMVSDFVKPLNSETWAGAASPANLSVPIDLTSDNEVCIKVWSAQTGNLLVKLEEGTKPNWENLEEITQANTWVELCYNTLAADQSGDANPPAAGGIYNKVVVFFDFGTSLTDAERTYYFDDIITQQANSEPVDITFSVDMNDYTESFTTVHVSGTFNDWSGTGNPLADDDNDGVWTGTVADIPVGGHEYKFTIDDWAAQEDFNGADYTCTVRTVTDTDVFTNRTLAAAADATLPTVCYNSCYACGDAVMLTVNLGEAGITVSDEGLYIAGGANFSTPGEYPLTDDDGDGIHSGSFERERGFESFYTFTNGACTDFSCKEMIAGQDCSNPDNFDDRFMGPLNEDTTISTCFGLCTDNADCMVTTGNITFSVDMNAYAGSFTTVFLSGNFNSWSGNANPLTDNGSGIWSTTIPLASGNYEYKFQVDEWAAQEEFMGGEDCTMQSGNYVNRTIMVDGDGIVCFEWGACASCLVSVDDVENTIFSVQPTLVNDQTTLIFGSDFMAAKTIRLYSATGQNICLMDVAAGVPQYTIDAREFANGMYFIHIQTENKQQTQRIIVNK